MSKGKVNNSAEKGLYMAQAILAFCYEYGLGTEVDLDMARAMFKQAGQSEKAHGKHEEHLAMLEVNEENYDEALCWLRRLKERATVLSNRIFGIWKGS